LVITHWLENVANPRKRRKPVSARLILALERYNRCVDLLLMGWRQSEIAAEVGISQAAVSKHLNAYRDDLERRKVIDKTQMTVEHLDDHARLRKQANIGWTKSLADAVETTEEVDEFGQVKTKTKRAGQAGDPRFLGEVRKLRERDAKIVGLDAPTKQSLEVQGRAPPDVDEETIETIEVVTPEEAEKVRGKRWLRIPQNGNGHAIIPEPGPEDP
jgi:predicted transcriptional regulator